MKSILRKAEVSLAQVGPREFKDPRSREYAIQTLYALKRYAESLRCDEERVEQELQEIERYRHWEVLGYASKDAMLAAELDDRGRSNVEKVKRAKEQATSIKQGTRTDKKHHNNIMKLEQGTGQSYTLRRLVRLERDDLLARIEAGELTANAAAIAAGFRKKMISIPATDLDAAARIIAKHYDPTDFAIAISRLRPDAPPRKINAA